MSRGWRSGRIGISDKSAILKVLHDARDASVAVQTSYPIKSNEYLAAVALNDFLEDLAEALTGDRKAHWSVPMSSSAT